MDIATKLRMVLSTLDGVEVKGKKNLDRLLGSMQAIEEVVQVLNAQKEDVSDD